MLHKQAKQWYNGQSKFDIDKYHNNFTEDLIDNDVFAGVMEDGFEHNECDNMSKAEIIQIISEQPNLPKKKWNEIKSKLKSMGFVYNFKKRKDGNKGCIMNIHCNMISH